MLFRSAEMLEGRKAQFIEEISSLGISKKNAEKDILLCIDRIIYYAGWCDKFQAIYSSVNPVASSHYNFSVPEPMGVVSIIAPDDSGLLGLLSVMLPSFISISIYLFPASFATEILLLPALIFLNCKSTPTLELNTPTPPTP